MPGHAVVRSSELFGTTDAGHGRGTSIIRKSLVNMVGNTNRWRIGTSFTNSNGRVVGHQRIGQRRWVIGHFGENLRTKFLDAIGHMRCSRTDTSEGTAIFQSSMSGSQRTNEAFSTVIAKEDTDGRHGIQDTRRDIRARRSFQLSYLSHYDLMSHSPTHISIHDVTTKYPKPADP